MVKGLGVYAPMALLPTIIIDKVREKYEPDIYRTSIMILKLVSGDLVKYRFWVDKTPDILPMRELAIVEVMAQELTEGEQAVIDTVLKIAATAALKKV
ncbi:MAG: hypothetical protein IKW96_10020 [Ruminococcus sp.]|uniref:hypothetical protein n=1 Tax=Ruminococcus sp. TaxID=41978 RepID=UPI0025F04BDB|nr:hypothetical protein [Ruminococcus sp.]MBR5683588.1 hypothetical protein [Ruminococcus sp.]